MAKVHPPPRPLKGKGVPPAPNRTVGNLDQPQTNGVKALNLKVSSEFHRELKTYAAQHGITMTELLQRAFEFMKAHREA